MIKYRTEHYSAREENKQEITTEEMYVLLSARLILEPTAIDTDWKSQSKAFMLLLNEGQLGYIQGNN